MNKLYTCLALLVMLCANVANADVITYNGNTRQYIKYVPADLGDNRPLLVSMHGMNQDANYQKGMLRIESIADTAKFAVVFPEGINRAWDISGTSDINFVLALIDEMARLHNIDKNRVYLSGFSMGGMFTYHAINHIADKIAAFAPISGYPMGGQPFTSSRPVPIIHTHGTGDDVVNFDGVQRSLDGWIERNNCSKTPIVTEQYRYNGCTRHQWGPGDESCEVVLIELANKGHWISNDGFYTGEEIWNFCKRYSLDDKRPTVNITYPLSDTEINKIGSQNDFCVNIEANATSDFGDIATIDIYGDNELLGSFDGNDCTINWGNLTKGSHMIIARATDVNGNTGARAVPITAKVLRTSVSFSFSSGDVVPNGWITFDGRVLNVGEKNLSAGSRVIEFTGSPRSFNYGIYTRNATGKTDNGYVAYGDKRGRAILLLNKGTYELSFEACSFNRAELDDIRAKVFDVNTGELLGEVSVSPSINLGGSTTSAFGDIAATKLTFEAANDLTQVMMYFYTADERKADLVVGDIKLKKVSSDSISDITADEASPVIKVEYYDMFGRIVASPRGLVIRKATHTDGSITTDKVVY